MLFNIVVVVIIDSEYGHNDIADLKFSHWNTVANMNMSTFG